MKRILPIVFSLIFGGTAFTDARFFNAGTITNAIPIDAAIFVNQGTFMDIFTPEFPYSTRNTRYFTNTGVMTGSVGFQIDTVDPTALPPRRPLTSFYNGFGATISGVDNGIEEGLPAGTGSAFADVALSLLECVIDGDRKSRMRQFGEATHGLRHAVQEKGFRACLA